ncbi:MAG: hypothetical protein U9P71_03660 [Campylobacterota bacterium]|nr:hypothetical protein [Campylobacterota bacterium]
MKKSLLHNKIVKIALYFLLSFALILPVWLQVNNHYNHFITNMMFHVTALKYEFNITKTSVKESEITFTIKNNTPIKDFRDVERSIDADVLLDTSSVTFNVPMTLALLLALALSFSATLKEKSTLLLKSMSLLILLHVITILIISVSTLIQSAYSSQLMQFYLNRFYLPQEFIFNFASILNSYASRFEPFLLAIFMWWMLQGVEEHPEETVSKEELPNF